MLEKVKLALRLTTNAYDTRIQQLIDAAKTDLQIAGVVLPPQLDAICEQAITTYCMLYFLGLSDQEFDRLSKAYDMQKGQLRTATGYTNWETGNAVS